MNSERNQWIMFLYGKMVDCVSFMKFIGCVSQWRYIPFNSTRKHSTADQIRDNFFSRKIDIYSLFKKKILYQHHGHGLLLLESQSWTFGAYVSTLPNHSEMTPCFLTKKLIFLDEIWRNSSEMNAVHKTFIHSHSRFSFKEKMLLLLKMIALLSKRRMFHWSTISMFFRMQKVVTFPAPWSTPIHLNEITFGIDWFLFFSGPLGISWNLA